MGKRKTPPSDDAARFRRAFAIKHAWERARAIREDLGLPYGRPGVSSSRRGRCEATVAPSRPERIQAMLDSQGGLCAICHRPIPYVTAVGFPDIYECATIDHIVPRSRGGTGKRENLRIAHWLCNNLRGNRPA